MKQNLVPMIDINEIEELTAEEKEDIYLILFDPYDNPEEFIVDTAVSYSVGEMEEYMEEFGIYYDREERYALTHLDNLLLAAGLEKGTEVWLK